MRCRPAAAGLPDAMLPAVLWALMMTAACNGGAEPGAFIPTGTPTPTPIVTQTPAITPTSASTPTPAITPTPAPSVDFGAAVVGDDGSGFIHGLQVAKVEDARRQALPTPQQTFAPLDATDIDGVSITPDGTHGAAIDGVNNTVFFFTMNFSRGAIAVSPATVDVSAYGGDGDTIASLPGGDAVVASAGGFSALPLISGVLSDKPVVADLIPTGRRGVEHDGLVISSDGMVMLSRAGAAGLLDVYSILQVAPHPGSLGGTVAFQFTLTNMVPIPAAASLDGREGMAISPTDSSRAVVVGGDGSVNLLADLPANVTFKDALKLASAANAVAISIDGKFAIVATNSGLAVFSGVDTGKLAQVGPLYSPTFSTPSGSCTLHSPDTLAVTSDGKFVLTIQQCHLVQSVTQVGSGVMLTIPFSAGVLGPPAGRLDYAVTPDDDQLVAH